MCPTGFKVGLNDKLLTVLECNVVAPLRNIVVIGNNTVVSRAFSERIGKKYDLMHLQRAFVHWHVGECMKEGEFIEVREDLGFLEKDYTDRLLQRAYNEEDESVFYFIYILNVYLFISINLY